MIWMDVDTALSEVPVNACPLIDDTDFKTIESAVAYNAAGMSLTWHFVTTAGAHTSTAVTPTTAGNYDWAHQAQGMYTIEIPASGGASINNDTEGFGWFTGIATGVLPWRGPTIGFRDAALNNALIDSAYSATRGLAGTALPDAVAGANTGLPVVGTQIPNATAGASGGVLISGSNSGTTTLGALTVTGALTTGSIVNNGTLTQTGAVTLASSLDIDGFVSFSGAMEILSGTPGVKALVITGASGPGTNDAVSLVAGTGGTGLRSVGSIGTDDIIADIAGSVSGSVGSVTGAVGSVTGNVGGNVVGSVGSVTGAVGSVTGNVGGSTASVTGAVGSVTGNVGGNVVGSVASVTAAVAITSNVKKNQALSNFQFLMTDSTTHAPATGKTVSVERSIDGGAYGAGTLSAVTEVANGTYKVDFGAGDLNGNVIILRATATGCDDAFERIVTQP